MCYILDECRPDMDEVSMLTAITLFLLSASSELVGVTVLQKGCLDRFRNALNSSDHWVENLKSKTVHLSLEVQVVCLSYVSAAGSGTVLPAAVVSVSALHSCPVYSLHPRSCTLDGGETQDS